MSKQLRDLMRLYDEDYFIHGKSSAWKQGYSERTMRGVHTVLYNLVKKCFPNAKSKLILGCAFGMQVKISLEHGDYAVGIDFTPLLGKHKMITNIVRGSVTHLPFRNGTFDLAVNVNLMEHVPFEHIAQVLREQKRVATEHFFIIAHRQINMGSKPTKPKKKGDITHVTMRPQSFWLAYLKTMGTVEYFEKKEPPPWNIYLVR